MHANGGSESCRNSPQVPRKLESYHKALLESGSQSAKSSPLPDRRLDKLQGVIRDKSSPSCQRRQFDLMDRNSFDSPIVSRKFNQECVCTRNPGRHTVDCPCDSPIMMRRRVDSDCSCSRAAMYSSSAKTLGEPGVFHSPIHKPFEHISFAGFNSPAKSVLGEPGVFSSPARSVVSEQNDDVASLDKIDDQTIVSGWLKFRDNKKVGSS
jgi:hypothetical protein